MANQSTTGFGLKPIRKVAQTNDTGGLGSWKKAASTTAILHQDLVLLAATGYATVGTAGAGVLNQLGSLNGSFYTDPSTSKPTWSQHAPNNAATDMECLVNDDPQQMFEMRTAITTLTQADAGATAPIVATAGSGAPNYLSGFTIGAVTTVVNQLKLIGITRDTQNQTLDAAGSVWRVMLSSHILGNNVVGI
jgi:hypothetical protein|tara:strand:- start:85 stop:660 length:576 start_codon:yes stop_codon:yes gene_type:complete